MPTANPANPVQPPYVPGDSRFAAVLARPLGAVDSLIRGEQGVSVWSTGRRVVPELLNADGSVRQDFDWVPADSSNESIATYMKVVVDDTRLREGSSDSNYKPETYNAHRWVDSTTGFGGRQGISWLVACALSTNVVYLPAADTISAFVQTDGEVAFVTDLYRSSSKANTLEDGTDLPAPSTSVPGHFFALLMYIWLSCGEEFDVTESTVTGHSDWMKMKAAHSRRDPVSILEVCFAATMMGQFSVTQFTLPQLVYVLSHSHLWRGINPYHHMADRKEIRFVPKGRLKSQGTGFAEGVDDLASDVLAANDEAMAWSLAASYWLTGGALDENDTYHNISRLVATRRFIEALPVIESCAAGKRTFGVLADAFDAIRDGVDLSIDEALPYFARGVYDMPVIADAIYQGVEPDLMGEVVG